MSSMSTNTVSKSMNGLIIIDADAVNTSELDVDTLVVNLSGTAPTVSALDDSNNIATTAWVNDAITAGGSSYVTLGTNQTITGEKVFNNLNTYINNTLTADTITATGDLILNPVGSINCNGKTIDMTGGEIHKCPLIHSQNNNNIIVEGLGTGDVILKTNGVNRVTVDDNGITTFSTLPECSVVPTTNNQLVNKDYVDNKDFVNLTTNQDISGIKTFNNNLVVGSGINSKTGSNLTLTTTAGEDVVVNGSNDITFNSAFNTVFNAGAYGSFQAGIGYTFVNNGSYGFVFNDNYGAGGGGLQLSSFSNNIVNTSVNNIDYNSATIFGTYYNGPFRGAIYDNTAYNTPIITFQNGQATDIGVTFNALNVFCPISNITNMIRVSIPFNILACSTFGLPSATATIGLRFDGFSVVYLKNGVAYTPTNNYSYSPATGTTINWNKTGLQTNVQGLASYFGNLEIAFNIDINNTSVDTYQVRINPSATITNYSINFDIFKFVCKNGTSGQTNGVSFRTTSATLYSGGTMTFAGGNPSFVDTSVTKIGLSYPVPPTTASCYMPLNNNITPPAMISQYAGSVAPSGWLLCDGGTYNISNYGNLYAVIGNLYGGSLSAGTFSVPDTRGVFVAGNGSSTFGGKTYTRTLGTRQNDKIQQHKHTYSDLHWYDENAGGPNQSIVINGANYQNPSGDNNGSNTDEQFMKRLTANTWENNVTQTNQYTDPTSGQITSNETYPANIALNYIIKY